MKHNRVLLTSQISKSLSTSLFQFAAISMFKLGRTLKNPPKTFGVSLLVYIDANSSLIGLRYKGGIFAELRSSTIKMQMKLGVYERANGKDSSALQYISVYSVYQCFHLHNLSHCYLLHVHYDLSGNE